MAKPFHLTVMSQKIDFVIKGNEKVKFMLNWIYFFFIDFPQEPNPCQIRMFVKKSEHFQFHAVPVVIAWEILKLTLSGSLIKFRWSKFYSVGVYFQLKLHALTHAEWPISFHFLFHGLIETDCPGVVRVKDPRTDVFLGRKISQTRQKVTIRIWYLSKICCSSRSNFCQMVWGRSL